MFVDSWLPDSVCLFRQIRCLCTLPITKNGSRLSMVAQDSAPTLPGRTKRGLHSYLSIPRLLFLAAVCGWIQIAIGTPIFNTIATSPNASSIDPAEICELGTMAQTPYNLEPEARPYFISSHTKSLTSRISLTNKTSVFKTIKTCAEPPSAGARTAPPATGRLTSMPVSAIEIKPRLTRTAAGM